MPLHRVQVNVWLDPELHAALKARADAAERSVGAEARMAVRHWLGTSGAVERALEPVAGSVTTESALSAPPAPAEQPRKTRKQHSRPNARITRIPAKTTQSPSEPVESPPAASQDPTGAPSRYRQSVPGPNVENIRSSSQVKDFKPYPKGGKR